MTSRTTVTIASPPQTAPGTDRQEGDRLQQQDCLSLGGGHGGSMGFGLVGSDVWKVECDPRLGSEAS